MRVSIVFPLLMMPIMRWNWKINFTGFFVLSLLGTYLTSITNKATDYPATLHYLVFFVVGALIAKHRLSIVGLWQRQSKWVRYGTLVVAFMLYAYARVLGRFLGETLVDRDLEDLLIGGGASLLIVWLLASTKAQLVMEQKPLVFLGRVSYSLYLLHPLVLLVLVHAFAEQINVYLLLLAALPLSIFVAWLSYRWIEMPSMVLGRRLATRNAHKNPATAN